MHITRLRLIGFKSFVEPTELLIEPGLTGVVGPNGCGKSNLLEALRWVMGETSYKSMRASAMDDVIFSGTNGRPARNMAEVTIFIDNSDRLAPAEFNDNDQIEITRRIEREAGSAYRINGSEVRARDVKILFEDAATGARSPALVRQGQIGEIVNAKPEQRRRILEDAAGTAGLHSRRHEAELRLRGAEANLARIGDVVGQLKSQIESLKRQARQARRYSELSEDIRKAEALQAFLSWSAQHAQVEHDEAALQVALEGLGAATIKEAEATKLEAEISETLQPLREQEMTRAAVLARLQHAQTNLDNELRRAQQREQELQARVVLLSEDLDRERQLVDEARGQSETLRQEKEALEAETGDDRAVEQGLEAERGRAEGVLAQREDELGGLVAAQSEAKAERHACEVKVREQRALVARLEGQSDGIARQLQAIAAGAPDAEKLHQLQSKAQELTLATQKLEEAAATAEAEAAQAREAAAAGREESAEARLLLRQAETERETLAKVFLETSGEAPPIADQLTVAAGFEVALGAALGDDLDVPVGVEDGVHWRAAEGFSARARAMELHALPAGAEPLGQYVTGAAELADRLAMTGVIDPADGPGLQGRLLPGQRLVSRQGDLWRWDGLVAPADVPTAAAQRLAARNRLKELIALETSARSAFEAAAAAAQQADQAARDAQEREQKLRRERRDAQASLATIAETLKRMEQAARETEVRLAATKETQTACSGQLAEAREGLAGCEQELAALPAVYHLDAKLSAARESANQARDVTAEIKARVAALHTERQRRRDQLQKLSADLKRWSERAENGAKQIAALEARLAEAREELASVTGFPAEVEQRRQRLLAELMEAEAARRGAGDALVEAEAALKDAGAALRAAQATVGEQRELRARADARLEAARGRRAEIVRSIEESFETSPEGALALAGHDDDEQLPDAAQAETRLQRLRADRDRLGGVNLQAGEELDTLTEQFTTLDGERADVEEAIAKLRSGIANLNREGRRRLKEAFETVDSHFQMLFSTLFGGGEAKLEMIEDNEDPLAGGLEIIARPPGKKPTTLSLLSGGEQTLTALSLIFAVFLTNPSPICVLDEVDAPLDDANVDRFCTLMEKMAADTDTRFLVITHHPMTMARVDRLFGVTMVERGVSQLVSVDLAAAEGIMEAG